MRVTAGRDLRPMPREEAGGQGRALPEHDAEALTGGGREALIRFNGQTYTLRITRQSKLLLTK